MKPRTRKKYLVTFSENGEEYYGWLLIRCYKLERVSSDTIRVDGALITIDENITNIQERVGSMTINPADV